MTRSCRHCNSELTVSFCDLGMSPLANSYLTAEQLDRMEPFYPLHAYVCSDCFLVQLQEFETPEHIFTDYAYFSSFSDTWVAHAKAYVEDMVARFGFDETSQVIEIASNDGYLLQFFAAKNVPVLGIEPAANVAKAAEEKGIPTLVQFFNPETATSLREQGKQADLLLGNNVLAHVPALNDFVSGMKIALKPRGNHHDGISAPASADGTESIRHDLSRAFLVPIAFHGRKGLRGAWASGFRCAGGAHAWWLPPHLCDPHRERRTAH